MKWLQQTNTNFTKRNQTNHCSNCIQACQQNHKKNCFALGKKCNNCGIVNHFAKICKKPKQKNQNRNKHNIKSDKEVNEETVKNVENINTSSESEGSSSDDKCVTDDNSDKIAPQNMKMTISYNQKTPLHDSGSVCSIHIEHLATSNIKDCKEEKTGVGKQTKHRKLFKRSRKGTWNADSTNR